MKGGAENNPFLLRTQVNEVDLDSTSRKSLLGVEYWHTKGIRSGPINH
jgi:hypothetical protein